MNPAEFQNIARSEEQMWWFRGMRSILRAWVAQLPRRQFQRVLEGGCGTGYMSRWMNSEFGWPMTAVDLDFGGLSYGRRQGIPNLVQADICRLPFATASFDALVSLDVLVHFPRGGEGPALAEFARVLAPGAPLILRVSALDILRSRHSQFAHERQRFTAGRLRSALAQAGFLVDRLSYANALLFPVALAKFRLWEPLTQQPPQSGVSVPSPLLNRALQFPLEVEARCLQLGLRFPLGQSLLVLAHKAK